MLNTRRFLRSQRLRRLLEIDRRGSVYARRPKGYNRDLPEISELRALALLEEGAYGDVERQHYPM